MKYKEEDSVYFVQTRFNRRKQLFFDPTEWKIERKQCCYNIGNVDVEDTIDRHTGPQVVVIDMGGHFVCGLICKIVDVKTMLKDDESSCIDILSFIKKLFDFQNKPAETPPGADVQNCLVIFNTTEGSYIGDGSRAHIWTFDSFFPP